MFVKIIFRKSTKMCDITRRRHNFHNIPASLTDACAWRQWNDTVHVLQESYLWRFNNYKETVMMQY